MVSEIVAAPLNVGRHMETKGVGALVVMLESVIRLCSVF
jgi:hypothetical protein